MRYVIKDGVSCLELDCMVHGTFIISLGFKQDRYDTPVCPQCADDPFYRARTKRNQEIERQNYLQLQEKEQKVELESIPIQTNYAFINDIQKVKQEVKEIKELLNHFLGGK